MTIPLNSRIYGWVIEMSNARTMWSDEKTKADHDKYLEYMEYTYNGINVHLEKDMQNL